MLLVLYPTEVPLFSKSQSPQDPPTKSPCTSIFLPRADNTGLENHMHLTPYISDGFQTLSPHADNKPEAPQLFKELVNDHENSIVAIFLLAFNKIVAQFKKIVSQFSVV